MACVPSTRPRGPATTSTPPTPPSGTTTASAPPFGNASSGITASSLLAYRCRPSPCARAFPGSKYYGGSAPSRTDRPTVDPAPPRAGSRGPGRGPRRFPCSLADRSMKEEPGSASAASPQVRRRPSSWPPRPTTSHRPRSSPTTRPFRAAGAHRDQPVSVRFELVGAKEALHHRFLTYSSPSRSPNPRHLTVLTRPGFVRAAPTLPGTPRIRLPSATSTCCDRPTVQVSHLHSINKRLTAHGAQPPHPGPWLRDGPEVLKRYPVIRMSPRLITEGRRRSPCGAVRGR